MLNRRQLLASIAPFAVGAPALLALADNKPPIRIGAVLPMTGPAADYGVLYNAALKMAVDDVNAAGGINGSKLDLIQEDDRSLTPVSVGCFRKIGRLGAVVAFGPLSGPSWEAVEPITKEIKLPTLCFTASRAGNHAPPYALRIAPPDDTAFPEGVAEFMKLLPAVKRIAIAGDAQDAAGMEFVARVAKDFGLDVVATVACKPRTDDFSPDAGKIRDANPDAVFISSREPTSLPLVKALEAQGFDKPILFNSQIWASPSFIHVVGAAGKNVYTIGFSTNETDPANATCSDFVKRFIERTKVTTSLPQPVNACNAALAHDALLLAADIMRKAGVDGTTMADKARELVKAGLEGLKNHQGIHKIALRDTGDGHIKCNLLKANAQARQWEYALAPDQRINASAPFKARG